MSFKIKRHICTSVISWWIEYRLWRNHPTLCSYNGRGHQTTWFYGGERAARGVSTSKDCAARLPSYGLSAVEQICDTRRVRCQNGTCARTYRSGAKHRRVWKHGSRASAQFPQVSAHARSRARDGGASGRIGPAPRQALWRAAAKSVSGQHICKYIGIYVYIYY